MFSSHLSPGSLHGELTGLCKRERKEMEVQGIDPMICMPIYSPGHTPCSSEDSLQDSSGSDKMLLKKEHYLLLSFGYLHLKDLLEIPWKTANLYTLNKKILTLLPSVKHDICSSHLIFHPKPLTSSSIFLGRLTFN